MLPELSRILAYKNPHLISRYQKEHPESKLQPEEALEELLKYLWLCQKHIEDIKLRPDDEELQFNCAVHAEMAEIDNMWHTFLLFTEDYMNFCEQYFEKFLHHTPNVNEEKISPSEYERDLSRYLSYIYDNLGEATVRKWFDEIDS